LAPSPNMERISAPLQIAWQISAEESRRAAQPLIEPEHLLIGLCKMCALSQDKEFLKRLEPAHLTAVEAEGKALHSLMTQFAIEPVEAYRCMRNALPKGPGQRGESHTISRSEASKQVFSRANELAKEASQINSLHLLAAITE